MIVARIIFMVLYCIKRKNVYICDVKKHKTMKTKKEIINDAQKSGLKKCYLTNGKYDWFPGEGICFQASSFDEALAFAEKHGLSVSLCGRRTGWRDDVCFEVITCGSEPVTVSWVCERIFGECYSYFNPEMIEHEIECIFEDIKEASDEDERKRLFECLNNYLDSRGKHLIVSGNEFHEFESVFIEETVFHDTYLYFYCVMLDEQ